MTYNNANRKNIREAEKSSRLADTNRIEYIRYIMSTIGGRAWMYDLLTRCYMFHSPMAVGYPDATAWNLGKQDIGREVYNDVISHSPAEYSLMMQEASTKDLANGRRNESGNDSEWTAPSPSVGRNPDQSSSYTTDREGFVYDGSEPEPRDSAEDPDRAFN